MRIIRDFQDSRVRVIPAPPVKLLRHAPSYLARIVKADPSAVVFIGKIFFIDFNYCRGGEPVPIAKNLAGEISPAHLEISGFDTTAYPPPYLC